MVRRISGLSEAKPQNSQRESTTTDVGSVATTSAERGRSSNNASSPKKSPGPKRAIRAGPLSDRDVALEDDVEPDPLLSLLHDEGVLGQLPHLGVACEEFQLTVLQAGEQGRLPEPGVDCFEVVPRDGGLRPRKSPSRSRPVGRTFPPFLASPLGP